MPPCSSCQSTRHSACQGCGECLSASRAGQRYHSPACRQRAYRNRQAAKSRHESASSRNGARPICDWHCPICGLCFSGQRAFLAHRAGGECISPSADGRFVALEDGACPIAPGMTLWTVAAELAAKVA